MKKSKISQRKLILLAVMALILISVAVIILFNRASNTPNETEPASDVTEESSYSPTDNQNDQQEHQTQKQTLPKPTLNKSSGNNSAIPPNVLVNFTCSGSINTECKVVLTNTSTAEVIELEKMKFEENNRGKPSVVWTWKSITGTWKIVATVSAEGYMNNSSDEQELVVK